MGRFLLSAHHDPGHMLPVLSVARALKARGHEVMLNASKKWQAVAEAEGFPFVPYAAWDCTDPEDFAKLLYESAGHLARGMLPLVEEFRPDALMSDVLSPAAGLAAEVAGLPFATMLIHPWHLPSRDLPAFGFPGNPGRTFLSRWRDAYIRAWQKHDLAKPLPLLNMARGMVGLPPTDDADAMSHNLVLVVTLPCMEYPRSDWPARARIVGPCLADLPGEVPELPPGDDPLVVATTSTTGSFDNVLLETVLEALAGEPIRLLAICGTRNLPDAKLPPNARLSPPCPIGPIMAHASAAVAHGGHGGVVKALSCGVPLVVIPFRGDQGENARRVEWSGAGRRLPPRRLSASRLNEAVRSLLDEPSYREAALAARAQAVALDGPNYCARLLEELAGLGVPDGLPPTRLTTIGLIPEHPALSRMPSPLKTLR